MAIMALAAMTACTSEDSINDVKQPEEVTAPTYSVCIKASFGGDAQTRAVSFEGTASSSTFQAAERVYVFNATLKQVMLNAEGTAAGYLTPTNISADGKSCDLTGTLTGTIEATDELLLMYNLNEVYDGNDNNSLMNYSKYNYTGQDGTAAGVLDGATATLTGWSIGDGNVLTTAGTAQFVNLQSMFRFSFKDAATDAALSVKRVDITSQNDALVGYYYPMKDEASRYSKAGVGMFTDQALSGYVYMALCIDEASSAADVLTFEVTDGGGNKYEGTKAAPAAGFRNGKYYYSSAPIALTLKERRIMPTITWTTPSTAPETIADEKIGIEDDDADFALSGTSEGVCFWLVQNGTVRLNGLTASWGSDYDCFISGNENMTLDISGANTIACKNHKWCILDQGYLKLQGYGTLTVTANDPTQCGILGVDNYAPANIWQSETNANATTDELDVSEQLAATGYKVIRSARADNADGTYTWTYTVYPTTLNLANVTGDVTVYNGMTLTGAMTGHTLFIADGATVTLSGASVTAAEGTGNGAIRCLGNATIILADGTENVAKSSYSNYYSAVHWPEGKTLTITGGTLGTGKLTADGSKNISSMDSRAGIGGGYNRPCGDIEITGGDITALGTGYGAGIGATEEGRCGDITITGGNVTATGGHYGAGIGAGANEGAYCGNILISGGIVTATGGSYNGGAAGIGHGTYGYSATSVTITGGITSVTATRGSSNSGVRCIGNSENGSAKIDGKTINSNCFEASFDVNDFPTFPNLNFAEREDYKTATTWTLTKK